MAERSRGKPSCRRPRSRPALPTLRLIFALTKLSLLKLLAPAVKSPKYSQIVASIREIGIIEPPVVSRDAQSRGRYILLDGHLRLEALKELEKWK